MTPDVLTVEAEWTVPELARFLLENEISGAPVVDRQGMVVGVVSLADVASVGVPSRGACEGFFDRSWEPERLESPAVPESDLRVRDIMNADVYAVSEDATVGEVARTMLEEHVHRLIVTRADRVLGIISTSDLLGLLVETKEEGG
jgi:predicted transcriptional regulator